MRRKSNLFTALLTLAVGITLIVIHDKVDIIRTIVTFLGAMFIVAGFINILAGALSTRRRIGSGDTAEDRLQRRREWIYIGGIVLSVFGIALGVTMVIWPGFFAAAITYLFAAMLIAIGVFHIIVVAVVARPLVLSALFYIIPVLMIGAGVAVVILGERRFDYLLVLITGISLVASGVASLMEYVAIPAQPAAEPEELEGKKEAKAEKEAEAEKEAKAEDSERHE